MRKTYVKWREEGPDGEGVLKEDQLVEAKLSDNGAVCKSLQQQTRLLTERFEVKCFHKERERGRGELTSVITVMVIAVVGAQLPRKSTMWKKA